MRPPCTGPGWTTVLRGARRKPNLRARVVRPVALAVRRRAGADAEVDVRLTAAHLLDRREGVADCLEVDPGSSGLEPLLVDQRRGAEEVVGVAVEHHPDVDELLAVDPGDAAQGDVLVAVHAHRSPCAGSQARAPDDAWASR